MEGAMAFPWDFDIGSALAGLALAIGCVGLAALVYMLIALVLWRLDDDGGAGSCADLVPEGPIPYGSIGALPTWPVVVPERADVAVGAVAHVQKSGRRLAGFVLASGRLVELKSLRELTVMVAPRDWWN
jgi:hypothetical protein